MLKAVEELDYRPNYLARGLRQRNTCMIGLIIPDNANPFYAEVARAIEDGGFAAGYSVILCNSDLSEEKQPTQITLPVELIERSSCRHLPVHNSTAESCA